MSLALCSQQNPHPPLPVTDPLRDQVAATNTPPPFFSSMTGHMLQANECLAADLRRLLAPKPLSSFKTCPTLHSQAFSSVSSHCKLVAPPKLREGSWVTPRFCISAFNRESEQAKDTGFLRKKIAVFVSGGGSNFRNLHEASVQNKVFGDFVLVVSDKPD
ncbi:hypothetical protein L7F22_004975 [Adiantum nelumboides]|nr:hypothetical protein [Adiantum nelumboides]